MERKRRERAWPPRWFHGRILRACLGEAVGAQSSTQSGKPWQCGSGKRRAGAGSATAAVIASASFPSPTVALRCAHPDGWGAAVRAWRSMGTGTGTGTGTGRRLHWRNDGRPSLLIAATRLQSTSSRTVTLPRREHLRDRFGAMAASLSYRRRVSSAPAWPARDMSRASFSHALAGSPEMGCAIWRHIIAA